MPICSGLASASIMSFRAALHRSSCPRKASAVMFGFAKSTPLGAFPTLDWPRRDVAGLFLFAKAAGTTRHDLDQRSADPQRLHDLT